jgi:hypothetical protein
MEGALYRVTVLVRVTDEAAAVAEARRRSPDRDEVGDVDEALAALVAPAESPPGCEILGVCSEEAEETRAASGRGRARDL